MSVKEDIVVKFYNEHKGTSTIAKELGVRPSYVTKIIRGDTRYFKEKEERAKLQEERRKKYKKNWISKKRNSNRELDEFVRLQHIQASKDLSPHKEISDIAFVKWNRNVYAYSKNSSDLILKRKNIFTADVPKKVRNIVPVSSIRKKKIFV